MKTSLIILFSLIFSTTYSQINFQSDINKTPLYPDMASQIESIYKNYDFQFRFWIDGPLLRLNKKRLFVMTQLDNKWICDSYKLVYNRKNYISLIKPEYHFSNCDSVWNYFMQNHILDLPTMEYLEIKFNDLNGDGNTARVIIADGQSYSLEFLAKDKYKRLVYHCPITFNKEYPEIPELSEISNIIKLIFTIAKIKFEPC